MKYLVQKQDGDAWVTLSEHSDAPDAQRQLDLFVANGVADTLKVAVQDADGNITDYVA